MCIKVSIFFFFLGNVFISSINVSMCGIHGYNELVWQKCVEDSTKDFHRSFLLFLVIYPFSIQVILFTFPYLVFMFSFFCIQLLIYLSAHSANLLVEFPYFKISHFSFLFDFSFFFFFLLVFEPVIFKSFFFRQYLLIYSVMLHYQMSRRCLLGYFVSVRSLIGSPSLVVSLVVAISYLSSPYFSFNFLFLFVFHCGIPILLPISLASA